VQSQPDDLVWASGYAVLQLHSSGAATASYYQVQFNGELAAATSQLLWTESIPGAPSTSSSGSAIGSNASVDEPASLAGAAD